MSGNYLPNHHRSLRHEFFCILFSLPLFNYPFLSLLSPSWDHPRHLKVISWSSHLCLPFLTSPPRASCIRIILTLLTVKDDLAIASFFQDSLRPGLLLSEVLLCVLVSDLLCSISIGAGMWQVPNKCTWSLSLDTFTCSTMMGGPWAVALNPPERFGW